MAIASRSLAHHSAELVTAPLRHIAYNSTHAAEWLLIVLTGHCSAMTPPRFHTIGCFGVASTPAHLQFRLVSSRRPLHVSQSHPAGDSCWKWNASISFFVLLRLENSPRRSPPRSRKPAPPARLPAGSPPSPVSRRCAIPRSARVPPG